LTLRPAPLIVAEPRGRYAARPLLVVDCSVIAAVLFDEPDRDVAARALADAQWRLALMYELSA
jgi:hypothetical protein